MSTVSGALRQWDGGANEGESLLWRVATMWATRAGAVWVNRVAGNLYMKVRVIHMN